MDDVPERDPLEALWRDLPASLEREGDWALQEVLDSCVAGYTKLPDMPAGVMIRHNPDGSRQLVLINFGASDTVLREL